MRFTTCSRLVVIFTPEYFKVHDLFSALANVAKARSLRLLWSKLFFLPKQTFFFPPPSGRLTKMFLSYSEKSNLLCL